MSATFLVTGFEPFSEHRTNSSWDALCELRSGWPADIVTQCLPVDHHAASAALRRTLDALQPEAVLNTGLAKGRVFRMERSARRPSMFGAASDPGPVEGRWPWDEMRRALDAAGVDAVDSHDAGQYVCESTYWSLLTYAAVAARPTFAAFLHVPPVSEEHPIERIAAAIHGVVMARWNAIVPADKMLALAAQRAR